MNLNAYPLVVFTTSSSTEASLIKPVISMHSSRMQLSDFNGRSLSSFNSSAVTNDPDVPEAGELRVWYSNAGGGSDFKSISTRGGGGGTGDGERRAMMVFSNDELLQKLM